MLSTGLPIKNIQLTSPSGACVLVTAFYGLGPNKELLVHSGTVMSNMVMSVRIYFVIFVHAQKVMLCIQYIHCLYVKPLKDFC